VTAISIRRFRSAAAAVVLTAAVLAIAATLAPGARAQADAAAFIEETSQKAIDGLTDLSQGEAQREAVFRDLLGQTFDIPAIGRFVVGRAWRQASKEEKGPFLQVFEDVIVQRFLPLFAQYQGEQLIVDGAVADSRNKKFTIVNSTFVDSQGRQVKTDWRLHQKSGNYQVFDVLVEGVSMAITLRSEYASVIQEAGGLDGLVDLLRDKLAKGEFEPAVAAQ
jgi:phospholipid transport system substrate-binding protein